MQITVHTIGHSSHPIDRFIRLLEHNGIAVLADVRSIPASRRNPQYNRDALRRALEAAGIAYRFLGKQLGALTDDPALMENGRVSFAKIAAGLPFKDGLRQVAALAENHRVALMCAEKDPLSCHRTHLVSRHLEKAGIAVTHILDTGECEPHADTMTRLLKATGTPEEDLFLSREDLIDQAAARWEEKMMGKSA